MSSHDVERVRAVMQVRWDAAREQRVLGETLASSARRARHGRTAQGLALAAVLLLGLRVLPRAGAMTGDSFTDLPSAIEPAVDSSRPIVPTDDGDEGRGVGGFAGTSGRNGGARGASSGIGGGAGTG